MATNSPVRVVTKKKTMTSIPALYIPQGRQGGLDLEQS